jgi:hypothetical protein
MSGRGVKRNYGAFQVQGKTKEAESSSYEPGGPIGKERPEEGGFGATSEMGGTAKFF